MAMAANSVLDCARQNKVCKAFGIKLSGNPTVPLVAANADFDSLFIDLEHSSLTLEQAATLCNVGILAGITPLVRVPHQCGNGFVQRVLDGGAMGVIYPHIHSADDARAAVRIAKYPPQGIRSMMGQLPQLRMKATPVDQVVPLLNERGSTVIVMIESSHAVEHAEEIAGVDGVDVVLVGSSDLSIDLGVGNQFDSQVYRDAITKVGAACKKQGKIFGLAGVYDKPEIQDWAINTLGVRFMLVQQDISLISGGSVKAASAVPQVKS